MDMEYRNIIVPTLERMGEERTVKKIYVKMKLAWRMERKGGLWIRKVGEVMRRWGLKREWEEGVGEVEKGMWERRVRERKMEWVEKRWKGEVEATESKLEMFKEVKMKWGREKYLMAAGVESVMEKTRIRGGASELEVDRGRGRRGVEHRERKERV